MIKADLSGVNGYVGAVGGIIDVIESPQFQSTYVDNVMLKVRQVFMTEAIAANQAGYDNLAHMFEWGAQDARGVSRSGTTSNIPLFKLTKTGVAGTKLLGYTYLPSTKPVPLADPQEYGFSPSRISRMRRHVFVMKALVMETQSRVRVSPKYSDMLFIPSKSHPDGYYMSRRATRPNPGGPEATGAFARYWNAWMETRAQAIAQEEAKVAEYTIANSARKVLRYKSGTQIAGRSVGGQYASGRAQSFAYVNQVKASATQQMRAELARKYRNAEWKDRT